MKNIKNGLFLILFAVCVFVTNASAEVVGTNENGVPLVSGAASLSWNGSPTVNVYYDLYNGDTKLNVLPITEEIYELTLPASLTGTLLNLHLVAVSEWGIASVPSNIVQFIVVPTEQVEPPTLFRLIVFTALEKSN